MMRLMPPCCLAWTLAACGAPVVTTTDDAATTAATTGTTPTGTATTGDGTGDTSESAPTTTGAPDDRLRLHQLQALGTHNSYHLSPGTLVKEWDYTHLPLDQQLAQQGVRKFEL